MPFNANDIYTSSGATKLWVDWTENINFHDTSSFYNWEEDNLPLYDLRERTLLNWEQHGFPSSSVNGLSIVVSADAPQSELDCNSNLFRTIEDAIEALPQVIRFPVLIEVASFGDLGELKLENIKTSYNGSLEIINRNFTKSYSSNTIVSSTYSQYKLINNLSSLDLSSTLQDTSAMSISSTVLSSTADSRIAGNMRAVMCVPGYAGGYYTDRLAVSIADSNPLSGGVSSFSFEVYEQNPTDTDLDTTDVSAYHTILGEELYRANTVEGVTSATALIYGNNLSGITINNCDDKIYIRGFFVDGSGSSDIGVEVNNSNVLLENMAAVRFKKDGYRIVNSNVIFTRGLVAYRNYDRVGNTNKLGTWNYLSSNSINKNNIVAGLHSIHSNLYFSSTISREPVGTSASDFLINFSRNDVGVFLDNSTLYGGIAREIISNRRTQSHFQVELNNRVGLVANNSVIDLDGMLEVQGNTRGIVVESSNLALDEVLIQNNQREGLISNKSSIRYNKNLKKPTGNLLSQFACSGNGQHISLSNSQVMQTMVSSIPENTGFMYFTLAHGINNNQSSDSFKYIIPQVEVKNNSYFEFVHPKFTRNTTDCILGGSVFGDAVSVTNNSIAIFHGSKHQATVIEGPSEYSYQKNKCGIYAGNNSEVEFTGPTIIAKYAVDVLAESGSIINFNPPGIKTMGNADVSGFDLYDPENHTSVELHSTRACLVANGNSEINMINLGDYNIPWAVGANGISILGSGLDYITSSNDGIDTSAFTYRGSMQFYPNSNDALDYTGDGEGIDNVTVNNTFSQHATGYNYNLTDEIFGGVQNNVSAVTSGGVCLRALKGSKVNVLNTHFLAGWWNPSGIIYDISGADTVALCNRLFIWNISNDSNLNAAYVSVSGSYPQDSSYHGPSGVWVNNGTAYYGCPEETPDTSSLSVLDIYGEALGNILPTPGGSLVPFYTSSFENIGAFRLYVSPDSMVNYLTTPDGTTYGFAYQIYAQGYQPSGDLSAAPSVSSIYPGVLKMGDSGLLTSGYYYASSIMSEGRDRIMLDESAAHMFANAKHMSTNFSGRVKLVTIYSPHTSIGGESMGNTNNTFGRGFKSANIFDLNRIN